jgi:hypothetical protein
MATRKVASFARGLGQVISLPLSAPLRQVCGILPARRRVVPVRAVLFSFRLKRFSTKYPVWGTITRNAQGQLHHYARSEDVDL